jgi:transposase-like protein
MKCPKCQSENRVKNGFVRSLQRYKCKDCFFNYTLCFDAVSEREKKRRFALAIYLEGLGFHSIGRLLGVSHVTVINWVRRYGKELIAIRNPRPAHIVEMDEMHSYIGRKKTTNGFGLVLIELPKNTLISLLGTEVQKPA